MSNNQTNKRIKQAIMSSGFGVVQSKTAKARAAANTGGSAGAKLDTYRYPPSDEFSIEYLERCALDRFRLLKTIDDASSGGKKDEALREAIRKAEEECHLRRSSRGGSNDYGGGDFDDFDDDVATRDSVSHYLLRLASCENAELRRWFTRNETELFKYRFGLLTTKEKDDFMRDNGFDSFKAVPKNELTKHADDLFRVLFGDYALKKTEQENAGGQLGMKDFEARCRSMAGDASNWFTVDFEEVPGLVRARRAYMLGGQAWIRKDTLDQLVFNKFRARMGEALANAVVLFAKFKAAETNRLTPLLKSIHDPRRGASKMGSYQGPEGVLSMAGVEATKDSFPLCMRQLYGALKSKHHLTHGGRRQLQLYLKGIGLPLDQALVLWKTEFTKSPECTAEKFEKDYAYGIRHAYGKEGKRVNYTPHGCQQCIGADPGVRDDHGCPFKTLTCGEHKNGEKLHEMLTKMNISGGKSHAIVEKAKNMHYQIACGMTFAALHNGKEIDAGVHTPHQYYAESRKALAPPEDVAATN